MVLSCNNFFHTLSKSISKVSGCHNSLFVTAIITKQKLISISTVCTAFPSTHIIFSSSSKLAALTHAVVFFVSKSLSKPQKRKDCMCFKKKVLECFWRVSQKLGRSASVFYSVLKLDISWEKLFDFTQNFLFIILLPLSRKLCFHGVSIKPAYESCLAKFERTGHSSSNEPSTHHLGKCGCTKEEYQILLNKFTSNCQ